MTDQPAKPDYGDTLEAQILADMVANGDTLIDACRALQVSINTTYYRLRVNPKFSEMMDVAREIGYDIRANNIIKVVRGEKGYSSGDVKRDRMIAEYDMKLLAKWYAARYGEKIQIEQKSASVAFPVSDDPVEAQRQYEALMKGS